MTTKNTNPYIPSRLRWASGITAMFLILFAFLIVYSPPIRSSQEFDGTGNIIKNTITQAEIDIPFVTVFVGGLSLLLFAINGLLISKLSAAGVSAETIAVTQENVEETLSAVEKLNSNEQVNLEKENLQLLDIPVNTIAIDKGNYAVYKLDEIPVSVITDALSATWPQNISKPDNLSTFEFATRKTGQGNNPWILKFRNKLPVVVQYGGRGNKRRPTIGAGAHESSDR